MAEMGRKKGEEEKCLATISLATDTSFVAPYHTISKYVLTCLPLCNNRLHSILVLVILFESITHTHIYSYSYSYSRSYSFLR